MTLQNGSTKSMEHTAYLRHIWRDMVSIEQSLGIIPEPEGESDLHSDFTAGQERSGEEEVATTDDSYMETDA